MQRGDDEREVDEEDRSSSSACSISQPPATGPMAMPRPETPAQMPIAFAALTARGTTAVMIDSVEGMMNAPPMPIRARVAISISGEVASAESRRAEAEDGKADGEAALAAEAVAERAGGEQQAGEDEHVGVDDPLQLGAGRAEVALERRQRDVEDGVVEPDHEQRRGRGRRASTSAADRAGTQEGGDENETVPFRFMGGR